MTKNKEIHPIWSYFPSDINTKAYICLEYKHAYKKTTDETVLKNHFRYKHLNIWKQIKKHKRGRKKINKQISYIQEEVLTPIETNYESIIHFENQTNQDEENQILIHENMSIHSSNVFNIFNNIKCIDVADDKKCEMEFEYNKIKITGKCKIEFK
ncbi:3824_t:CDS:1 [Cetraspora pellucida]|uniref:3824_t:CDS:1 n=1 Tax=Cetraspora pellucida TaxID=1433469 RepID=A0ACA9QJA9_9GLOM|nr:3824_t:CDS:1 [Cetraspora pellucida]